jgi:hypothetical protein
MISSLQTKLNPSWKFWRSWNVPMVLLERSWWAGFNGIYLRKFGFRMWEILILKWFRPLKIQINSKKPGFERKSVEDVVTLVPMAQATLVVIKTCWSHLVHKFCESFIIIDFAIHVTNSMMFWEKITIIWK